MKKTHGFTLVEVMVAATITAMLVALLVSVANAVANAWQRGEAQAESHANARGAINLLTRELQGAVVDLDLGLRVSTVANEPNNFRLKFITRAEPLADGTPAVKKICYQLGWADRRLIPQLFKTFSPDHPVPVLLRTESSELSDVFDVKTSADADLWTREWGDLPDGGTRAGDAVGADRTDIAAENVLGWQVIPYGWDGLNTTADRPGPTARYYDKFLTSNLAPRALEIKLAVLPSRNTTRAAEFAENWGVIRADPNLFALERLGPGGFNDIIRQGTKFFSATIYLQSKTP